ncbi:hypothetical protein [Helicobacter suis]|uniref:hypothetical protein n=1 Tax=Helicobacter suis TaxID=104628 RepID=UPI00058F1AA2|nr:hypothetical protein [Helicobacter suis]BDR28577.1 hypothetical protein HSHS1_13380 [Helicobacter suis HS1]
MRFILSFLLSSCLLLACKIYSTCNWDQWNKLSKTDFLKNRGYDQISFKKEKNEVNIHSQTYSFIHVYGKKADDFHRALCVGVFSASKMQDKFCLEDMEDLLSLKNSQNPDLVELQLFQITKPPTPTTPGQKSPINLVFKLVNGIFYLARFSSGFTVFYQAKGGLQYSLQEINNNLLDKLRQHKKALQTTLAPDNITFRQPVRFQQESYVLIRRITTKEGKFGYPCLNIAQRGQESPNMPLCLKQPGQADFVVKRNYVTLEFFTPLFTNVTRKIMITFIYKGPLLFYLHQYSQQDYDRKGTILGTQIFYRQSFNDPKKEHLITFETFTKYYPNALGQNPCP